MGDPMTKINGHEVEYFINEKNRTVTAKIMNTSWDALHKFTAISKLERSFDYFGEENVFTMQDEMTCTAKCHPDDEFDVDAGMVIAYKKLQKKYWGKYAITLININRYLNYVHDMIYNEENKAIHKEQSIDPFSILNKSNKRVF